MNTAPQYPMTIVDIFNKIADSSPDRTAIAFRSDGVWTHQSYQQLRDKAAQIATALQRAGLKPGEPVILPAWRDPDLCACLLGILSAGGHYVFLDASYPEERQRLIMSQTGARLGIRFSSSQSFPDAQLRWLEVPREPAPDTGKPLCCQRDKKGESTAYIVFTSGSTGTPKGVLIPDRAVCRLVKDTDYIDFSHEQVFLQHSSLSFDASTLEIWGPLLNGGTCVIHPENGTITPQGIGESIREQGITTLWLTASFFNTMISEHAEYLVPVKQLLAGGEALSVPHIRQAQQRLPDTRLFNGYGPTENTTFTTVYPVPPSLPADTKRIPIGYPINGTQCDIFDESLCPVEGDTPTGELVAFGQGLASGYLNQPELTREKFVEISCRDGVTRTGYRTGDLVQRLADGSYDYLQRLDKQVKIDGHRIEVGEIDHVLNQQNEVDEARVVLKLGPTGQKRLAAYYVSQSGMTPSELRVRLADALPSFMMPHFFIEMAALPKNKNGKLDEQALPDPFAASETVTSPNQTVSRCWQQVLGRQVDNKVNFLEAGGTSLEAMRLTQKLGDAFSVSLKPTFVFEYPSIAAQAQYFSGSQSAGFSTSSSRNREPHPGHTRTGFAVVGMACRFPGAANLNEFWQNLLAGKESVDFFGPDNLSPEVDPQQAADPRYVPAKGVIKDCDRFDAAFFGIPPQEATLMDPQQRLLLELAWQALEDGNYGNNEAGYRTGVFAGTNWPRYFQQYVLPDKALLAKVGSFNASLANESDFVSSRIAYKLNLTGPAVNVFTACSTGLVAIAQACAAIEQGQCELALAGGASVSTPVNSGYLYQEGGMLSRDGHCRPFDASATGTTFNDGAGMVLIKRLDLAIRDGDPIYGVIKGAAINNDGDNKASFSAPSVSGQVAVYREALQNAGIDPSQVEFIEAHGTATPLGDPIEIAALNQVYGVADTSPETSSNRCAVGSVKSNIGHTIHAAGIASFIKAVLSVRNGVIPGTLFYENPNPKLHLDQTPFYINPQTVNWPDSTKRIAAISSLGVGGTNAHVLIENFPAAENNESRQTPPASPVVPLLLSAKSSEALENLSEAYTDFMADQDPPLRAVDMAYTAAVHRKAFACRRLVTGSSASEFADALGKRHSQINAVVNGKCNRAIGFLFSGQGSQRPAMGAWLYKQDAEFRDIFDTGCDIVRSAEGFDIRSILFGSDSQEIGLDIHQTKVAQPALFLVEYGVARYLIRRGCKPDFLIGHSIGEYAAACLAGIFSFEDAVRLVARRGALMQSVSAGSMLMVRLTEEQLTPYLDGIVTLAAVNAPGYCVISGAQAAVETTANTLKDTGISCKPLVTSHAFHSAMMEPIMDAFREAVAQTVRHAPQINLYSTRTGKQLSPE
ncbi:MAG: amino acid adenylation domain-containing protein, partial [Ketobacteraceae bacterium]|nr:amino acid adenylation domain-containing protein [Ketobacteraceae bacterium]